MSSSYVDLSVNYILAMQAMGEITEKNQLLQNANSELGIKLEEIAQNWESTGVDREEYYIQLKKQVDNLRELASELGKLKKSVINYLENIKSIASKSMN